ncbi:vWA domain-containing protein [Nocardia jinanensis]|uniref:VWA domain-containing protein n=1 Tax=Nocardia jinanensis TaxID=382504 RepID=A0A917RWV0_9NOCA|nr:VWA-like domain-containing protein [Nocardia jinanensis]GGL41784.1 hypothetical protein GCM10011588_65580 [Nocardia jinanensis]
MTVWPDPRLARRWAAGRLAAVQAAPYLATALLALDVRTVEVPGSLGDQGSRYYAYPVDQSWRVHVDPVRLAGTPAPELGYWLLHQVTHLLRDHGPRGERRGAGRQWNAAADLEVGDDLPTNPRPAAALVPARFRLPAGRAAEEYWRALAGRDLAQTFVCGLRTAPVADDSSRVTVGAEEARLLREETARRVAARASSHDDVPLGWERWARDVLEPVVDWRRELAATIRHAVGSSRGRVDHTYQRRSRRAGVVAGVILPGLRQPRPTVAVVLDTSRSMSAAHLERAGAELGRIIRSSGVTTRGVSVLCCDVTAHEAAQVLDFRSVRLVGGGGTDLRAGIAAAAALRPRPDIVVVLTDGWTEWPERPPPRTTVVVGLLGGEVLPPEWVRTVQIPLDEIDEERREGVEAEVAADVVDRT